jgi:hypothetical protein
MSDEGTFTFSQPLPTSFLYLGLAIVSSFHAIWQFVQIYFTFKSTQPLDIGGDQNRPNRFGIRIDDISSIEGGETSDVQIDDASLGQS